MEIKCEDILKEIKADAALGIEDLGLKDQFGQYVTLKNLRKIQINAEKLLSAVSSAPALTLEKKEVFKVLRTRFASINNMKGTHDYSEHCGCICCLQTNDICAKFATKAQPEVREALEDSVERMRIAGLMIPKSTLQALKSLKET